MGDEGFDFSNADARDSYRRSCEDAGLYDVAGHRRSGDLRKPPELVSLDAGWKPHPTKQYTSVPVTGQERAYYEAMGRWPSNHEPDSEAWKHFEWSTARQRTLGTPDDLCFHHAETPEGEIRVEPGYDEALWEKIKAS